MKYKRFYILILIILFIFMESKVIFATEKLETNELNENNETINTINNEVNEFENATYSFEFKDKNMMLNISNVDLNKDLYYYYYVTTDKSEMIDIDSNGWVQFGQTSIDFSKYYELNSEKFYLWIKKEYRNSENEIESKLLVNSKELQRISQSKLGTRLYAAFDINDTIFVICKEVCSTYRNSKVNYKIGEVTDKNILNSIKNGENNCLEKLLNYAKKSNTIKNGTIDLLKSEQINYNSLIKEKKYYFVYLELDDENGKYYPIEDISLYQAYKVENIITGKIEYSLCNYLSDKFKWELSESTDKEDTTDDNDIIYNDDKDDTKSPMPIPQTGRKVYIYLVVSFTLVLAIILYRKLKKYKRN